MPQSTEVKPPRREKQAYSITPTGNVVVNVGKLMKRHRVHDMARTARIIVRREQERPAK